MNTERFRFSWWSRVTNILGGPFAKSREARNRSEAYEARLVQHENALREIADLTRSTEKALLDSIAGLAIRVDERAVAVREAVQRIEERLAAAVRDVRDRGTTFESTLAQHEKTLSEVALLSKSIEKTLAGAIEAYASGRTEQIIALSQAVHGVQAGLSEWIATALPDKEAIEGIRLGLLQIDGTLKKLDAVINDLKTGVRVAAGGIQDGVALLQYADSRSLSIEHVSGLTLELAKVMDARSRTLEYLAVQASSATEFNVAQSQRQYVESRLGIAGVTSSYGKASASEVRLFTDFPIALSSQDHIAPESTMEGLARPSLFVRDCIRVVGAKGKLLDIGPGAGGLVYESLMNGMLAIGIDGSDFCRNYGVGYWPLLKSNLLTCDITKPFYFRGDKAEENLRFDIITMWEVFEHIFENDVGAALENLFDNLSDGGYFIGSISILEYLDKSGHPYHVTLRPKSWWVDRFARAGFRVCEKHPFVEEMFCRGTGPRYQDPHNYVLNPETGFHFVAVKQSPTVRQENVG